MDDESIDERAKELILLNIKNIINELGLRFLVRVLFNGFTQSIKDINVETLLNLKKGSHTILEMEKEKQKQKHEQDDQTKNVNKHNDERETFSFETTPNALLYYISEFVTLDDAINLTTKS